MTIRAARGRSNVKIQQRARPSRLFRRLLHFGIGAVRRGVRAGAAQRHDVRLLEGQAQSVPDVDQRLDQRRDLRLGMALGVGVMRRRSVPLATVG